MLAKYNLNAGRIYYKDDLTGTGLRCDAYVSNKGSKYIAATPYWTDICDYYEVITYDRLTQSSKAIGAH